MALEDRNDVQLIFFDISKSFDKVWHAGLLHKMRNIGINDTLNGLKIIFLIELYLRVSVHPGSLFKPVFHKGQFSAQSFFLYMLMTLVKILLQKHHYLQMIHLYQNTLLTV